MLERADPDGRAGRRIRHRHHPHERTGINRMSLHVVLLLVVAVFL